MREYRHLSRKHGYANVNLERAFWSALDEVANERGETWREVVDRYLAVKPDGVTRASWIRQMLVSQEAA